MKYELRITKDDLQIIMKTINMGDKVELTALQLVYLLDEAIEEGLLQAEDGEEVNTMVIAKEKVLELFGRTKVRGSEDGKDAGRGRYHAVYNQARDCWDLMFRDVLCASFYVGRYPCAEDKVDAEVSRLNAEYGKEANNG